jgi:4-hydroxybenzoate polyprenyltransferase
MSKENKTIQFGENVEGYSIPVLNEREIRATAGILFLFAFISILFAGEGNFTPIKYFVIIFLVDFLIRVFINPKFSPTLILGRWIVRRQTPEYVGAAQKKVAWIIGIGLAVVMFVLMIIMNTYSIITGLICLICLMFLFFESAFGICLGCIAYKWYHGKNAQYCPGEVCDIKSRHDIQKTSWKHFIIVVAFVAFIVGAVFLLNDFISIKPVDLFEMLKN